MANLRETIESLVNQNPKRALASRTSTKKSRVIAICSQKGGVGKTTTAVNLAAALAHHHNQKVLLIDLDAQGHVEKSLASHVEEGLDYTPLSEIFLTRKAQMLEGIVKTDLPNLHITPGDKVLYETEGMLTSKLGREYLLADAVRSAKSKYDIIIYDCPPNLGNLTVNALCSADYIIIPCEMSVLGFEGVSDLLETVDTINVRLNKGLQILGVVFTRVDERNQAINKLVKDNMRKMFKGKIFNSEIRINTDLNKAQLEGESIYNFAPSSTGALNYQKLSDEVIRKIGARKSTPKGRKVTGKKQKKQS